MQMLALLVAYNGNDKKSWGAHVDSLWKSYVASVYNVDDESFDTADGCKAQTDREKDLVAYYENVVKANTLKMHVSKTGKLVLEGAHKVL